MSLYFVDTSALVKYYRREEGSDFMERLFAAAADQRVISRLTMVEMESALATRVRTGEIDRGTAFVARRRLESDLGRGHLRMAAGSDLHFGTARLLVTKHGTERSLRTLDALQLAVAVRLKQEGFAPVFVAADVRLCAVAELEGFRVTTPENPTLTT